MSKVKEIIVLDDDEEEKEPPRPTKSMESPRNSSKDTNGKEEESGSSPQSKGEMIIAQNKTLFNEFIEYCSKLTSDHPEVISFLQGRYAKASPSYLNSVEFRNTMGRCLTRVQAKRSKVFVYINELCTALKANTQKRKVVLQTQANQQPAAVQAETPAENEEEEEAESVPEKKTGSKRQIRYLENLLRIYSQEITKLQEKELSLDELEDEDSSYIQESRLKRKLLRIFEKLCELKDCSSMTGRVIEQRIMYRGTRYPEVNRRLEKFINSSKDLFPDYGDVIRVVERANEKHSLGLTRKQMQSMAQDAFRELGNKLQDRRHLDMIYNFGCHLTDPYKSVNDPAQQDTSLSRRLRENRNTAINRLDDVIKKYAQLQDDGEEDTRRKTRNLGGTPRATEREPPEKNPPSSSEGSEESEDSETDIEEELEHSKERSDSEEGEHEEEELPADQENEADQKMDMASDGEKEKEDGEEATGQDSSPASSSTSHDKDSSNTTLESEVEAHLSNSPCLPSNGSPDKAKSDDERSEEQEACDTAANNGDEAGENQEGDDLVPSPEDKEFDGTEQAEVLFLNSMSSPDNTVDNGNHKHTEKYLLPDMTVSLIIENKHDLEQNGEDLTEPADDPSPEGSDDADGYSEPRPSPAVQEESCTDVNTEEPCASRRTSIDSEAASMEEKTGCTDSAGNHDDEDDNSVVDTAASRDRTPSDSPVREDEVPATNIHTAATDSDDCENKTNCDSSPLRSRNGVHMTTPVRKRPLNRLRLKLKTTLRDSCKPLGQAEDRSPPRRKRKAMTPEKCTNGLTRFNGKDRTEDHKKKSCKRIKIDHAYTSLSSSSDCDSIIEDEDTPGLMMTCCSPVDTPTKPIRKSHVSTQCDPDEVIVLSD
ncbi:death domain-associated protein 6 isoform 2-T2 [Anomaloglossus baeobatrachus]|uniref:death domain-associated protein 6 isoform X2 n=1 Tax=Anomaloglossus baeobatrachus TaxID=238106 RepID=UPI003F4FD775